MKLEKTLVAGATKEVARQSRRLPTKAPELPPAQSKSPTLSSAATSRPAPHIPSILLEGDDLPTPPSVTGPGEKFVVAPAQTVEPPSSEPRDLPAAYGTQALFLAAREPHCLHASWDLTADQRDGYHSRTPDRRLVLRVSRESAAGAPALEVPLAPEATHRFIEVPLAGTRYASELGYYEAGGRWTTITTSNVAVTPPETVAEDKTARFATMAPEPLSPPAPAPVCGQSPPLPGPSPEPAPGPPNFSAQPLGGASPPAPMADAFPVASPVPAQCPPPLEPSLLAAPSFTETAAVPAGEPDPRDVLKPGTRPDVFRERASVVVRREWTPARERALEEFTRGWTSRSEGNSVELLSLVRQRGAGEPWAVSSVPTREREAIDFPEFRGPTETPGVSSPRGGGEPASDRFWFDVNAELVIYGATEPGARLVFAGQPLESRPDGTFSFRLALPDGDFEVVLSAASGRSDDRREARLRLSRHTECRGNIGKPPGDPSLPPPPLAG